MDSKSISAQERADLKPSVFAGPHRTYPIRNQSDLDAAARLIGKAANPDEVRSKAIEIARRLNLKLPELWTRQDDRKSCTPIRELKVSADGTVSGFLVKFSTSSDPDLSGDFFTRDTEFRIETGSKVAVLYDHGLDPVIGKTSLGSGTLEIKDDGIWIEAQLDRRKKYVQEVMILAESGKLGWSSGTASHLVEREPKAKGSSWIKTWPLGLDASLTPTPMEPRTFAFVPAKSATDDEVLNQLLDESGLGYMFDRDEDTAYSLLPSGRIAASPIAQDDAGNPELGEPYYVRKLVYYHPEAYDLDGQNTRSLSDHVMAVHEAVEPLVERILGTRSLRKDKNSGLSESTRREIQVMIEALSSVATPAPIAVSEPSEVMERARASIALYN